MRTVAWSTLPLPSETVALVAALNRTLKASSASTAAPPLIGTVMVLGYPPDKVIGEIPLEFVHPDDVERTVVAFAETWLTSGISSPICYRARHRDGHCLHMEVVANNLIHDPDVQGVVQVYRDVTERVRAGEEARRQATEFAEKLREGEERARASFEGAPIALAHLRPDGRFDKASVKLREMLGAEDIRGLELRDVLHPDDLDDALGLLRRQYAPGPDEPRAEAEIRLVSGDGRTAWALLEARPGRRSTDEAGRVVLRVEEWTGARGRSWLYAP